MNRIINHRNGLLLLTFSFAAIVRIINTSDHSPLANFTPIGAMALFGGTYFSKRLYAYAFPILTLWVSDLFLNYLVFYHEWKWFYENFYWTYGSFVLIILVGSMIKKINARNVLLACISATLIHWIVSNFGVWFHGTIYPRTFEGLILCYTVAIPYQLYTLLSNIIFSAIFFSVFEWVSQNYVSIKTVNEVR